MNRKLWSNEEKVSIVLEILRGDESAASICIRHGVSATQVYKWLDRFLEGWTQSRAKARRLHLLPNSKYTLEEYLADVRAMDERIQRIDSELARVRQQMAELRQAMVDGEGIARFCEKATRNLEIFDDWQWRILLERMRLTVLVDDTGITVKMAVPTVEEDTGVIVAGTCQSDDR